MVSDSEGQNLYVLLWGTPSKMHLGLELISNSHMHQDHMDVNIHDLPFQPAT